MGNPQEGFDLSSTRLLEEHSDDLPPSSNSAGTGEAVFLWGLGLSVWRGSGSTQTPVAFAPSHAPLPPHYVDAPTLVCLMQNASGFFAYGVWNARTRAAREVIALAPPLCYFSHWFSSL